jgi:Di-haem oxidoreductase, putative peroxidase
VVRPQGWKGNVPTFRAFGEDAAFGEMGMLSDRFAYVAMGMPLPSAELGAFAIPDVDGDGVNHEMSVGDITAIQFYFAAQSRPTTLQALQAENAALLTRPLTADETALIAHGDTVFNGLGCSNCHVRALGVIDPVFRIPDERHPAFRDAELQGTPNGYDTSAQIRLDLSRDRMVETPHLTATGGVYQVPAMTDLKRHFLGNHLCDGAKRSTPVDSSFRSIQVPADSLTSNLPLQIDSCHFLTADLWGIGQTSPYMHDGRAATLREAIAMHCSATGQPVSEADLSCRQFAMAPEADQTALIGFLMSQVFRPDDPPPPEP